MCWASLLLPCLDVHTEPFQAAFLDIFFFRTRDISLKKHRVHCSPTQLRRDSGKTDDVTGSLRKSSVDVAPLTSSSRRMSIEPCGAAGPDRRKGSTETSVSGYFKRSPIQARRESDDLGTL